MSWLPAFLLVVLLCGAASAQPTSLRFFGHGVDMIDRVEIRLDDPALPADPGPPADVGASDFTLEFFVRGDAADNVQGGPVACNAANIDWIFGNIAFDRDRFNQDRKFGLSFADSGPQTRVVVFGVSGDGTGDWTVCGTTNVLDGAWHHVAVQRRRSDGQLSVYVDGVREGLADGPDGDISYPDDGVPGSFCGPSGSDPCDDSDPFLVIAAEKHDAGASFPSFAGRLDEVRLSTALRYAGASVTPPSAPFTPDADTAALYHFDGVPGPCPGTVSDSSGASGGPSDGSCEFGGTGAPGPVYSTLSPFAPGSVPALPVAGVLALGLALLAASALYPVPKRGGAMTKEGKRGPLEPLESSKGSVDARV